MELGAPGLENAIVRLELFRAEHRTLVEASGAIEDMWRWMPVVAGGSSFENYVRQTIKSRDEGRTVPFTVFCQSTDAFAGVCEYALVNELHRRVRISSCWHPPEKRGTAIFPATQALLISRALDWGARRIGWTVDARNEPAFLAFQKIGAVHEGTLRSFMRLADGSWADMHQLSMTRDEAKAALAQLRERLGLAD